MVVRSQTKLASHTIRQILRSGKSNRQIALELGVHRETIVTWRRKYGIPRFTPHGTCKTIVLTTLAREREGVFQSELTDACGCSRQKLYWILKTMREEGLVYALGETNARRWYLTTPNSRPGR